MKGRNFELNEQTLSFVKEIGGHMPGGFFIYKAEIPEELIYANKAVFNIFGCADQEEFAKLTGITTAFPGPSSSRSRKATTRWITPNTGSSGRTAP